MSRFDLAAYLRRIGRSEIAPTAEGLFGLQGAQMRSIPFENIDPLTGREPDIRPAAVQRKLVEDRRGGYCFELNTLLGAAMAEIGFPVRRLLARVRMGAARGGARSHLALRTEIDGTRYLVDAGFGGPAPLAPLLFDHDGAQAAPNGTFRLIDDPETGERVVQRETKDGWFSLYGFDEAFVGDPDLAAANHLCAFWPMSPFSSHLLLNAYRGDARIGIFDRSMTVHSQSGEERRELTSFTEFADLLTDDLGIRVDRDVLYAIWPRIPPRPSEPPGTTATA